MSVNGPQGVYAPVRGPQSDVLRQLRRGDWTKGVPALSVQLRRTEFSIWRAVADLDTRKLVRFLRAPDGSLRIWITTAGRRIRL